VPKTEVREKKEEKDACLLRVRSALDVKGGGKKNFGEDGFNLSVRIIQRRHMDLKLDTRSAGEHRSKQNLPCRAG